ncbi:MAG: hypothetical protein EBU92_13915 [Betaproteobacteria bacterium]|nr:hypothetical protein [Betaproteobacteria bacterium]
MKGPDFSVGLGFLFIVLGSFWWGQAVMDQWRGVVIPGFLTLMAFGSVFINTPFTLPYAKEQASPETWSLPHFLIVNQILSLFWGCLFLGLFLASVCVVVTGIGHPLLSWLLAGLFLLAGFRFTVWYPYWHEKNIVTPRLTSAVATPAKPL